MYTFAPSFNSLKLNRTVRDVPRTSVVSKAASVAPVEAKTIEGPVLSRKDGYHGPHAVPEEGISRITDMLRKGDLFRYGGQDEGSRQTSYVESEFAAYTGHKYCVALNSCGSAIYLALWGAGVKDGDKVLSNALTFNAVPSAIHHARATGVFIECLENHTMCMDDMALKIKQNPDARYMLVSHMRGQICEMDQVKAMCDEHDITLIEDCAHSVGIFWGDQHTGHHGKAACYSTQSHKAMNSGEGGFLCTDDEDIAAKAIVIAGGYEKLFLTHIACPSAEVFERIRPLSIPNFSVRMSALTAATIRPQIKDLPRRIARANQTYKMVKDRVMAGAEEAGANIRVPLQHPKVVPHKDSLQFSLIGYSWDQVETYLADVKARGVPVAVFGLPGAGLARDFRSWRYMYKNECPPTMSQTEDIIEYTIDLRLPPAFTDEDFRSVADCLVAGFGACGKPAASA